MTRSQLIAALRSPPPQAVLSNLAVEALASQEMNQALERYRIPISALQEKLNEDSDIILAQVAPEYQRYEHACSEGERALSRFDNISAWLLAVATGYLAVPPRPVDQLSIIVTVLLLLLFSLRLQWRRMRRTDLAGQVSSTRQGWVDTLRDTALLPYIRNELTSWVQKFDPLSMTLDRQVAPGLSERHDPKHLVTSEAMNKIETIMAGMSGGSLGISGRRGIGKSTLINAYSSDWHSSPKHIPELRVLVSAPVNYDARDFILHVFARLCDVVLDQEPGDSSSQSVRYLARPTNARSAIGLTGLAASALVLIFILIGEPAAVRLGLGVLALAAAVISMILVVGWRFDSISLLLGSSRNPPSTMRSRTLGHLSQLQFVQTLTTGSSASMNLSMPITAQAGLSTSRELAEQPVSLPQLVSRYVDYATEVATWWRTKNNGVGHLVMGIDEVDRIRDSGQAEAFLSDIKAIFDIPYCFYLVSLSEDAVMNYDARALAVRSAFDTAFDEIVAVDPLSFSESEELLAKRIIGLPQPFAALCYVLAGGLPRDLIRSARTLVEISNSLGENTLSVLATALVDHELSALKRSCLSQLPQLIDDSDLLEQLNSRTWPSLTPESMRSAADGLWKWQQTYSDPNSSATVVGLAVSCSFYSAVLAFFGSDEATIIERVINWRSEGPETIRALAEARQAMAVNPHLARRLIERYYPPRGLAKDQA